MWCGIFAGIGGGAVVMGILQQYGFACMGQSLTRRLRVLLFRSVLQQARQHTPPGTIDSDLFFWSSLTVDGLLETDIAAKMDIAASSGSFAAHWKRMWYYRKSAGLTKRRTLAELYHHACLQTLLPFAVPLATR